MYHLIYETYNTCWHESSYSRLIYYFTHHLMYPYEKYQIFILKNKYTEIRYSFNDFNNKKKLLRIIIKYAQSIRMVTPTLFIICSDFDIINMQFKNNSIDILISKDYNYYHIAQLYTYEYFAELLNMPIIDTAQGFHDYI